MKETMSNPAKGVTEQAFGMWEEAVRNGLKMQGEALKCFQGAFNPMDCGTEMQAQFAKLRAMTASIRPSIQKRTEEILELIDKNTQMDIELRQMATEAAQATHMADRQSKWMDYCKLAMEGVHSNAEALVQMEARAVDSWLDSARKSCELK